MRAVYSAERGVAALFDRRCQLGVASFHAARRTASACIGALDATSLCAVDDVVARRSGDQPNDCAEATCDHSEALVASARQTKLRTWGAFIGCSSIGRVCRRGGKSPAFSVARIIEPSVPELSSKSEKFALSEMSA